MSLFVTRVMLTQADSRVPVFHDIPIVQERGSKAIEEVTESVTGISKTHTSPNYILRRRMCVQSS
jgi:hypothetical protein